LRGHEPGPSMALICHVDTVPAQPSEWTHDPWSGDLAEGYVWGRGALDMKDQVASETTACLALARSGWRPPRGDLLFVCTADEETGAHKGAQFLCSEHPDKVRCDMVVNEGAGQVLEFEGRRLYGVCVGEKGVFRFTLTTEGVAGHASIPRIGDNALVKMAPVLEALRDGRPALESSPEGDAFLRALGLESTDLDAALLELEERDPRVAVLLEPMFGVTMTPTMISASQKINVIPARAELQVDCRVPPELGAEHARQRIEQRLGADGWGFEFGETVVGNRSPADSPLMDRISAFVEREDPGAGVAPVVLPGFSDSRWFRAAFPDCTAYGFFPQRAMDVFQAASLMHGADERVPVEDLGLAATFYAELAMETLR
ncbi:MAG TPA: M20/M25/M40 family metallo-hydrolase, partial [Thermoleophilaceae bacterium]|nr:M20/M25/M40 family metallo-hydrolase [Thermoleophilaceae bacterium]